MCSPVNPDIVKHRASMIINNTASCSHSIAFAATTKELISFGIVMVKMKKGKKVSQECKVEF